MGKFNFYDFLGVLADAAAKKADATEKPLSQNKPKEQVENTAALQNVANDKKRSFADKKTVIEMIRNHDALSRKISNDLEKRD